MSTVVLMFDYCAIDVMHKITFLTFRDLALSFLTTTRKDKNSGSLTHAPNILQQSFGDSLRFLVPEGSTRLTIKDVYVFYVFDVTFMK
jgi:hypothetical protein